MKREETRGVLPFCTSKLDRSTAEPAEPAEPAGHVKMVVFTLL